MRKKVLPVMALTYEAFCACIEQNVEVIYVDMVIYKAYVDEIYHQLKEHGYNIKGYAAKRGVFFTRGVDVSCCEISNPYQLF